MKHAAKRIFIFYIGFDTHWSRGRSVFKTLVSILPRTSPPKLGNICKISKILPTLLPKRLLVANFASLSGPASRDEVGSSPAGCSRSWPRSTLNQQASHGPCSRSIRAASPFFGCAGCCAAGSAAAFLRILSNFTNRFGNI